MGLGVFWAEMTDLKSAFKGTLQKLWKKNLSTVWTLRKTGDINLGDIKQQKQILELSKLPNYSS